MSDSLEQHHHNSSSSNEPQCQFFVQRKKRLCRMTVKPGRMYCGEHEPQPKTADGQDDTRIPCPNDPKHTCYVSKLEKHLLICNARPKELPRYIEHNYNVPGDTEVCERKPLSQLSKETILSVIEKVNTLYEKHVKGQITTEPEHPIHSIVLEEYSESDRGQSSLRHLRQVSSLLWLTENEGLVRDYTCYAELGAGKGVVSYYACKAWCTGAARDCCALLVDRATLRHKRDNKLRQRTAWRVRADLAHLALHRVPAVQGSGAVVGLAKHLCGVATDYALRCLCARRLPKTRGLVLATCCHHRCDQANYLGNKYLQEFGITGDDLNVMLGIVSWATCGDGRSRERRNVPDRSGAERRPDDGEHGPDDGEHGPDDGEHGPDDGEHGPDDDEHGSDDGARGSDDGKHGPDYGACVPDNGKHGQVENARGSNNGNHGQVEGAGGPDDGKHGPDNGARGLDGGKNGPEDGARGPDDGEHGPNNGARGLDGGKNGPEEGARGPDDGEHGVDTEKPVNERLVLTQEYREEVGRRAKHLIDWGRVLHLRNNGFEARLCYYVPTSVSLENVCIVAKRPPIKR